MRNKINVKINEHCFTALRIIIYQRPAARAENALVRGQIDYCLILLHFTVSATCQMARTHLKCIQRDEMTIGNVLRRIVDRMFYHQAFIQKKHNFFFRWCFFFFICKTLASVHRHILARRFYHDKTNVFFYHTI